MLRISLSALPRSSLATPHCGGWEAAFLSTHCVLCAEDGEMTVSRAALVPSLSSAAVGRRPLPSCAHGSSPPTELGRGLLGQGPD